MLDLSYMKLSIVSMAGYALHLMACLNMEEISGTIQNSLADVGKDESGSRIKQWINKRRSQLKPWTEFMNAKAFSKPKDVAQASRRIVKNLDAYQTNYIAICLFLAIYCMYVQILYQNAAINVLILMS